LAAAVPATWLTVLAVSRARLPYNEEGNHFDGLVVHHEGSAAVFAALALVLWLLAVLAGWSARRLFKAHGGVRPVGARPIADNDPRR
jgi:hypothetical protein